MKKIQLLILVLLVVTHGQLLSQEFSMEQVSKFSFPSQLTASLNDNKIAWAMNEQGKRNVYLAEAPDFKPQKLTSFNQDDGQEISSLKFSPDGQYLVFVRGGDHGGGNADKPVNPTHKIEPPKVKVHVINLQNKKISIIGEGDDPIIGKDNQVAYVFNDAIWYFELGKAEEPVQLLKSRGRPGSLEFSPDGNQLLFVSYRDGYSFIGIHNDKSDELKWISPGFYRDRSPRFSPDGKNIVFVRTAGGQGAALPLLESRNRSWEIWVSDVSTGESYRRWKAPETMEGSIPTVDGGYNLYWAADNKIIYLSYQEGWPNLYAMDAQKGASTLLTKGDYHLEHVAISPDKKSLVFSANSGSEEDLDRRHIGLVKISEAKVEWKTRGDGIEAYPVFLQDNSSIAYLSSGPKRPLLPAVVTPKGQQLIGENLIPEEFPENELVVPKQVSFYAEDGTKVYGQLFDKDDKEKKPGIVFIHGGPQRQMLLGWSYMDYYSNTYAVNQYLANAGFTVLSVNYRLGIGYGYDFHKPEEAYYKGASEYQDIKAAGLFLSELPQVNKDKIGVYGGSYGGYLTALALGKDPDLFKVGVDIHGVHDFENRYDLPTGYEVAPDYEKAKEIAWKSSPLAYLEQWKAPVLFIHGDDDRNVNVSHTLNFIRRFEEEDLPYESLMLPGETHHWMKFSNMVKVNKATVNFLSEHLLSPKR